MSLGSNRTDHMVCAEPLCPTTSDPFTGRIICRCYQQLPDSRGYQPNGQYPAPTTFSSHMYPSYGIDPLSTTTSMLTQQTMRMDNGTYPSLPSSALSSNPIHSSSVVPNGLPPSTLTSSSLTSNSLTSQFQAPLSPSLATASSVSNLDTVLRSQVYNYMNMQYSGFDMNGGRRKNATRETTAPLKAWLKEHMKNPYPTKAEKVMLAIVTKMTLTQISTWFANARRRLKKENKGEWNSDNSNNSSDEDNTNEDFPASSSERLHAPEENSTKPSDVNDDDSNSSLPIRMQSSTNGVDLDFNQRQQPDSTSQLASSTPLNGPLPSFSTFMCGNSSNPQEQTVHHYANGSHQQAASSLSGFGGMYHQSQYTQPTSNFHSGYPHSTYNNLSSYNYDSVANYFKNHPNFAHEYNVAADKENLQVLDAHNVLSVDLFNDTSAGKHSDSDSSGQKSSESSPSSVKSKIWSISEIIGSSMSKINESDLGAFAQSLLSDEK